MNFKSATLSDKISAIVVYTIIFLVVLVTIYPLYFIIIASVSDPTFVSSGQTLLIPKGVSLDGYQKIFEDQRVWTGYRNTILYTLLGTTISIVGTIPAAYALSRKELPFRGIIMFFFTFTMFFNGGLIPTYFLMDTVTAYDKMKEKGGIKM